MTDPQPPGAGNPVAAVPGRVVDASVSRPLGDAMFDTGYCLNCGALLTGPHCASCGQKKATRIGAGTVRTDAWSRFRWFEWQAMRHVAQLLRSPGRVSREYVLGMRKNHLHPLSTLFLAIGALLLVLAGTNYLAPQLPSEEARQMYDMVSRYGKWSFSLGALAVFASAWLFFRGRLGYNLWELLVLALYCQASFIALQIINQLPLLVLQSPQDLQWHKTWSPRYMTALQALVVGWAYHRFFLLDLRQDGIRLLLAAGSFALAKWGVTSLYAYGVVSFVLWRLSE